jgi:hypothetical protein
MTLRSRKFQTHQDLTKFVNDNAIVQANMFVLCEAASAGYTLFWWA